MLSITSAAGIMQSVTYTVGGLLHRLFLYDQLAIIIEQALQFIDKQTSAATAHLKICLYNGS